MKKIISVIGARPQFIKHEPLKKCLSDDFNVITVHTGQHYDNNMSDVFFKEMNIGEPEFNLNIGSASHAVQTAGMMVGLEEIMMDEEPDAVIIYGDTNSTLAGALAAAKLHIDIAHIEAGMRSYNMNMPEEINRLAADRISKFNFAPSLIAMENLKNEGIKGIYTGDIMYDAYLYFSKFIKEDSAYTDSIYNDSDYILLTLHRAYNTGKEDLIPILHRIDSIGIPVLFPIHPRTKAVMNRHGIRTGFENIHFIEPLGYIDMITAINKARCIITDSGGLQKEAYYAKKKCITIRTETEWPETISSGANVLCPGAKCDLSKEIDLDREVIFKPLYGEGNASEIIKQTLLEHL